MHDSPDSPTAVPQAGPQEFFYFRCPEGHENHIPAGDATKYERVADDAIVVRCQSCTWQSAPFTPALFQHTVPGDLLFWVYTTRPTPAINSMFHIAPPAHIASISGNTPPSATPASPGARAGGLDTSARPRPDAQAAAAASTTVPPTILGSTQRIERLNLDGQPQIVAGQSPENLAETIEIAAKTTQMLPMSHYGPSDRKTARQAKASWAATLLFTAIWVTALGVFGFYAMQAGNRYVAQITAAIHSLEIKTTTAGVPTSHGPTTMPDQSQYLRLLTEQQTLLAKLNQEQAAREFLQKSQDAFMVSYEEERRARLALDKELAAIRLLQRNLEKRLEELAGSTSVKKSQPTTKESVDAWIGTTRREAISESLYTGEKDFFAPTLSSQNGNLFMFYDDLTIGNKTQKNLKLAALDNGEIKAYDLFQSKELREKQGEIPFCYSWDGTENAVLLTRIEGDNSLYHLKLHVSGNKGKAIQTKKIVSASYPEILGGPALSPQGQWVAFLHKTGAELLVKIYSLKDGQQLQKTVGGADTSKIPAWSNDSKLLFFLTMDGKGLIAWKWASQEKISRVLSEEIYGRYLAVSPDNRYLAFFQRSSDGKGRVNLCLWEWEKGSASEIKVLQSGFLSTESCRPAWNSDGRYLAIIHSGAEDKIVVQDLATEAVVSVFHKAGKIEWLDWSSPAALLFTYKEGLFTRPYRIRFGPMFEKK